MELNNHLPWILLLGGIVPLILGPLLAQLADRIESARSAVDAFTAVALGGIVLLHIWPHAFLTAGVWTLVGGLLGLLLPFVLHGSLHAHEEKIYPGFVVLAFLGLAVHATLDGVALFSPIADAAVVSHESHDVVLQVPVMEGKPAAGELGHDHGAHEDHGAHDEAHDPAAQAAQEDLADHDHADEVEDTHTHQVDTYPLYGDTHTHKGETNTHHEHGSGWLLAVAVILHRLPMGLAVWWFAVPILGRRFAIVLLAAIAAATVVGFSVAGRVLVDFSMPAIAIFEATIAGMLLHVVMGHDHGHAEQPDHHVVPWASALGTLVGVGLVAALAQVHPMEQRLADALTFSETFRCLAILLAPWLVGAWLLDLATRSLARVMPGRWATWRPSRRLVGELGWPALAASWALLGGEWTAWRVAVVGLGVLGLIWMDREALQSPSDSRRELRGLVADWLSSGHGMVAWGLLAIGWVSLLEPMIRISLESLGAPLAYLVAALTGAFLYRNGLHGSIAALLLFHMGWTPGQLMTFLLVGSAWTLSQGTVIRRVSLPGAIGLAAAAGLGLVGFLTLGRGPFVAGDVTSLRRLLDVEPSFFALGSLVLLAALGLYRLVQLGFRGFLRPIFHAAAPFDVEHGHHHHGHGHHAHGHHHSHSH